MLKNDALRKRIVLKLISNAALDAYGLWYFRSYKLPLSGEEEGKGKEEIPILMMLNGWSLESFGWAWLRMI